MNALRKLLIATAVFAMLLTPFTYQAGAVGPKVSELAPGNTRGNKHNLSAIARQYGTTTYTANLNTYQATDDSTGNPKGQQICIFCHTPHSANVEGGAPLWNRRFSTETFSRYSSGTLEIRRNSATSAAAKYETTPNPVWQPDGSSKLCLSCHDGSNAAGHGLGDVLNGAPIAMTQNVISFAATGSIASFNPSNNKMKTGHHPVSFVYNGSVASAINTGRGGGNDYVAPPTLTGVKLDKNSKMQCTTCHNAHQNLSDDTDCYLATDETIVTVCDGTNKRKVAPFWANGDIGNAGPDRDAVCTTCHSLNLPATTGSVVWP